MWVCMCVCITLINLFKLCAFHFIRRCSVVTIIQAFIVYIFISSFFCALFFVFCFFSLISPTVAENGKTRNIIKWMMITILFIIMTVYWIQLSSYLVICIIAKLKQLSSLSYTLSSHKYRLLYGHTNIGWNILKISFCFLFLYVSFSRSFRFQRFYFLIAYLREILYWIIVTTCLNVEIEYYENLGDLIFK